MTSRALVESVITQGVNTQQVVADISFSIPNFCVPVYLTIDNAPLSILPNEKERVLVKYKIVNNKVEVLGYKRPKLGTEYCTVRL